MNKFKRDTSISFGTSCMNRLYDLEKTYIKNIKLATSVFPNAKFVLLNYNSQDDMHNWVETNLKEYIDKKIVKYLRNTKAEVFNQSKTKNTTMLNSEAEVVVNLDADNYLSEIYLNKLIKIFESCDNPIVRCIGGPRAGRIACYKKSFLQLGGFDETMTGWGFEDEDFVVRFKRFYKNTTCNEPGSLYHLLEEEKCGCVTKDPNGPLPSGKQGDNRLSLLANEKISMQNLENEKYIANLENDDWGTWFDK